ncbi:MAG: GNAT family N-acetyltransferase [Candidatus Krumholzibacteriia bacterium]
MNDARRRLESLFGGDLGGTSLPLAGHRRSEASPGDGEPADLVLDVPNRRLKLYGPTADEAKEPELRGWKDGLRTCADLYTKLTVYARPGDEMSWVTAGYLHEGIIQGFFADGDDAHIWAAFGDEQRSDAPRDAEHDRIVQIAAAKDPIQPEPAPGFFCHRADPPHAPAIAELMDATFADYPTPIAPEIIRDQIAEGTHVFRFMVDETGSVVASASAEIDHPRASAEMTDCATRPDQRGSGHMAYLLHRLARDVKRDLGITDLYTLARADEVGMNCVFGKLGYRWTGRLINNCRMPNGWESMNIWCRNPGIESAAGSAG